MREWKGLGVRLKISIMKPVIRYLQHYSVYTRTYDIRNMWTFVYKEVEICASAAARRTGISLEFYCFFTFLDSLFMFYQAFGVNLSFNRCDIFLSGGSCMSIRYCASCPYGGAVPNRRAGPHIRLFLLPLTRLASCYLPNIC